MSPTTDQMSANHALQFLPGKGHRWLLSITVCTSSTRHKMIHCWDTEASPPARVATYRAADLVSFAVNTEYPSPAILALQLQRNNQSAPSKAICSSLS
jgi:hypothetical protein